MLVYASLVANVWQLPWGNELLYLGMLGVAGARLLLTEQWTLPLILTTVSLVAGVAGVLLEQWVLCRTTVSSLIGVDIMFLGCDLGFLFLAWHLKITTKEFTTSTQSTSIKKME